MPMYILVDEDQAREPSKEDLKPLGRMTHYARRQSVSAERYDPELDDSDEEGTPRVVYPKSDANRRSLVMSMKDILIFKSLDQEQLNEVVDAMFERCVIEGEHVITQGDDGDNFYVIETGVFDVLVTPPEGGQPNIIHQFCDHGSFGELALLYNMPRSATVISKGKGHLWAMDRLSFRRIVLKSAFKKRQKYEALLQDLPMLEFLEPYERMNLADALTSRTYSPGSCIIRQKDENADGMFFVESGVVRVTLTNDNFLTETEIVSKTPTTYFGEMALVENQPRSASVYAGDVEVKVAFLERESFERLLGPCLDIMKRNMATYEKSDVHGEE